MQVESQDARKQVATKKQRQASEQVFETIIGLNKYVNPINSKTLDAMRKESLQTNEIHLRPAGDSSKVKTQIQELYKSYVKQTSDDMLEQADKHIDNHRKPKKQPKVVSNTILENSQRSDHSIRKPQHQWWKTIDNTYRPFVTQLKGKPHGHAPIPDEIVEAQENQSFKVELGAHRQQQKMKSLPNPYKAEIERNDQEVDAQLDDADGLLKIEPKAYEPLEQTEFLYVDTVEQLEELTNHLKEERVLEIAIDLEAHTLRSY